MRLLAAFVLAVTLFFCLEGRLVYAAGPDQPEYILASLNAGGRVSPDDVTIQRFRYLLSSIQSVSGESPSRIADMVAKGRDLVRIHYGKNVSLLAFTEDANRAMRAAPKGRSRGSRVPGWA